MKNHTGFVENPAKPQPHRPPPRPHLIVVNGRTYAAWSAHEIFGWLAEMPITPGIHR
jgi:hypothetical protein